MVRWCDGNSKEGNLKNLKRKREVRSRDIENLRNFKERDKMREVGSVDIVERDKRGENKKEGGEMG